MMVSLINLRKVEQENNLLPRLNSQFLRTVLNACYIRHVIDSGEVLIFFDNLHQERALYVLYTIV